MSLERVGDEYDGRNTILCWESEVDPGRPRKYWLQGVTEVTGMSLPCAVEMARDRDRWRSLISRVVRDQR